MFARLGNLFLIIALLSATGAHWGVLQSVAWTTMLAGKLGSESLGQSVRETFDGQHPCDLCENISAAKQSEKRSEFPSPTVQKLEYLNEKPRFVFAAPTVSTLLPAHDDFFDSLNHTPPSPPPRAA